MKRRVTVTELRTRYDKDKPTEEWIESDHVESDKEPVVAAFLRGLADKLDPPKVEGYR